MRPDPAGSILLHPDPGEAASPGPALPIRARVVLGQGPQRGPLVFNHDARGAPRRELAGRELVPILTALRKVDPDNVVRRASRQQRTLLTVDHVVRRSDYTLQPARDGGVIVQRAEGFDLGYSANRRYSTAAVEAGWLDSPQRHGA